MREGGEGESVREFLRRRGAPDTVVARGMPGLIESWERTATAIEQGYAFGLDDYLNDMDARQLIDDAWGAASDHERRRVEDRLADADRRVRERLVERSHCLWGDGVAQYHGWSRERNWWYFMQPASAGADLTEELNGL